MHEHCQNPLSPPQSEATSPKTCASFRLYHLKLELRIWKFPEKKNCKNSCKLVTSLNFQMKSRGGSSTFADPTLGLRLAGMTEELHMVVGYSLQLCAYACSGHNPSSLVCCSKDLSHSIQLRHVSAEMHKLNCKAVLRVKTFDSTGNCSSCQPPSHHTSLHVQILLSHFRT